MESKMPEKLDSNSLLFLPWDFTKIQKTLKAIEKYNKEFMQAPNSWKILANRGWYLPVDFNLEQGNLYAKNLNSTNEDIVDQILVS